MASVLSVIAAGGVAGLTVIVAIMEREPAAACWQPFPSDTSMTVKSNNWEV